MTQQLSPLTTVIDLPAPPTEPAAIPAVRRGLAVRHRLAIRHRLAVVVIFVAALALRLTAITRSYELFIDETTYATIARNLAGGRGLTLYGQPFTLHPAALFGFDALVIEIFGIHGSLDHVIMSLRPVSAVFGALVCCGVYQLVRLGAGRGVALLAAAVLALDPLSISYDSLVMLEAPAGAAAIGVFAFIAAAAHRPAGRGRSASVFLAGVMAAVVVTTKDTFGLVVMAALVAFYATGWVLRRREVLVVIGIGAFGYFYYLVCLAGLGDLSTWWRSNVDGLLRLIGAHQETGFNAPTVHVTLVSRAFADLGGSASSYLILALGPLAALALLRSTRPWRAGWQAGATPRQRVAVASALWTVVAAGYLVYATLFGSIEEQMYYILLSPALCSIALAAAGVQGSPPAGRLGRRRPAADPCRAGTTRRSRVLGAAVLAAVGVGLMMSPAGAAPAPAGTPVSPAPSTMIGAAHRAPLWEWAGGAGLAAVGVLVGVGELKRNRPVRVGAHRRRSVDQRLRPWPVRRTHLTPAARRVRVARAAAGLTAVTLVYNSFVWRHVHATPADGYNRFLAWESTHIPPGTTMSVTDGSAQFLLTNLDVGDWDTLTQLRAHQVQWVLVSARLVDQGYTASPAFLRLLEERGQLLYSSQQPIGLRLYDVRALTGTT